MPNSLQLLVSRIATSLVVVALVTLAVFFLMHLIPGDPVDVMLGEFAQAGDRQALRAALGLDLPLYQQLAAYLAAVCRFDFGYSLANGHPVASLLATHFTWTALLAAAGLVVAMFIGIPLGLAAAMHGGVWDRLCSGFAVLGLSVPNFVLGPLLIVLFAVNFGWFPVGGTAGWNSLVLPALTLGSSLAAMLARMTRAAVLDVMAEPYVVAARARGLGESRIVLRYILANAALPVVTVLGLQLGALLGGAVVTEVVFAWPGLGQLLIDSIHRRDYPVVQACVLVISVSYILINTLTDCVYQLLDPRLH